MELKVYSAAKMFAFMNMKGMQKVCGKCIFF